jgi:opacity protein-like surface antigen
MSKSRSLVAALLCSLVAMPTISSAQAPDSIKEQAENFSDVLKALLGPNWNVFAHGGFTRGDRFSLQHAPNTLDGQRALNSSTGFNVGVGGGVDLLLRMGLRANYTFASNDLKFKTDDGTGSDALNIDDVGTLKSHTLELEVMRYMLPSRAMFTPYGTLGFHTTWWSLNDESPLVTSNDASPFSYGPLFSFGVQFRPNHHWSGRLEAALSSGHNPFTGNKSFRALSGPTIDEPSSIGRSEYRIAGVYHFGKATPLPAAIKPVAKKK